MKYAYWVLSVASCSLGAVYIADDKWLLGTLWLISGVMNGIIAGMSN